MAKFTLDELLLIVAHKDNYNRTPYRRSSDGKIKCSQCKTFHL